MSDEAQNRMQHPGEQHPVPPLEQQPEITYPGATDELVTAPDHGELTYRGSGKLLDRRALITGGDSGIGRAVALAFAREGADVVLCHLPEEGEDGRRTAELVEAAGRSAVLVPGDIREEDFCRHLVATTVSEFGGIDILVNNAAYQHLVPGGIADMTTDGFDRVMKTNLYALFWLSKFAVARMEPGSAIVNTTSIQAVSPSPGLLDYATTKAGIVDFTKGLAADVASKGIRVNAVAPGPIWTPLIPATMPKDAYENFGKDVPLGRPGQPAELAPAYVFLASQDSSYITGETIAVTGGVPFT